MKRPTLNLKNSRQQPLRATTKKLPRLMQPRRTSRQLTIRSKTPMLLMRKHTGLLRSWLQAMLIPWPIEPKRAMSSFRSMNNWTLLPQLRTRKGLVNSPPNWPPWSRTCRAIPGSPASSKLWQVMQLLRSLLVTRPKQESMLLKRLTKTPSKKHLLELMKLSLRKSKNKFV